MISSLDVMEFAHQLRMKVIAMAIVIVLVVVFVFDGIGYYLFESAVVN